MGGLSLCDQIGVALLEGTPHRRSQPGVPLLLGLVNSRLDVQQQALHRLRPQEAAFFGQKGQFAQVVRVAQRVGTGITQVGGPPVVDRPAAEARQDADRG